MKLIVGITFVCIFVRYFVGTKGILQDQCLKLYVNQQEYKGTDQAEVNTEQGCFDKCKKTRNCGSFEWVPGNFGVKCFTFSTSNPPPHKNRTGIYHYTFNCECSWIEYLNKRRYNGKEVSAPTFDKCGETCLADMNCEAIEWDTATKKCYFFDTDAVPNQDAIGINHYIWKCKPKDQISRTTLQALVVQATQAPDCYWSYVSDKNALDGTQISFGNTLKRCKESCVQQDRCRHGFDWRPTANPAERCWLSKPGPLYTTIGVKHYWYNCTNLQKVWHKKEDENTKNGKVVYKASTLEECKEHCVSKEDGCQYGLDWNMAAPLGQQCWISIDDKLYKALELGKVVHYYLDPSLVQKEGLDNVVSEDCVWSMRQDTNSPGGIMKPNVGSVEQCKYECKKLGSEKCKGIDWNPSDPIKCWLSTSDDLTKYEGVTHYILYCPGKATPTATSMASTTSKPANQGSKECGYVKYANSASSGGQKKSYMSDSDCRSQCSVQQVCKAYQWNDVDKTCTFFNNDQLPQEMGTRPGSHYYIFKLCT